MSISTNQISDTQFLKAREMMLSVQILDARTFLMPSATRPGLSTHHLVQFDDALSPREYTCTCEAGEHGKPCWAAARALDVMVLLLAMNAHIGERRTSDADAQVEAAVMFDEPLPSPVDIFGCRRTVPFKADRDAHPEALLAPALTPTKPAERVRGFQI